MSGGVKESKLAAREARTRSVTLLRMTTALPNKEVLYNTDQTRLKVRLRRKGAAKPTHFSLGPVASPLPPVGTRSTVSLRSCFSFEACVCACINQWACQCTVGWLLVTTQ